MNSTNNNTNLKMNKLIIEEDYDVDVEIVEVENKLKALKEHKMKKDNITRMRKTMVERKIEEIKRLKEALEKAEMELDAVESLDDDELADTFPVAEMRTVVKKTGTVVKKTGSTRGTPTKYYRVADWLKIADGTELAITYGGKYGTTRIFTKVNGSLVCDGKTYATMGIAGKAFYAEFKLVGNEKSFNAWAEFKILKENKWLSVGEFVRNI